MINRIRGFVEDTFCDSDLECLAFRGEDRSGGCIMDHCSNGGVGSHCCSDSDCKGGHACNVMGGYYTCNEYNPGECYALAAVGESCTWDSDCASGDCSGYYHRECV